MPPRTPRHRRARQDPGSRGLRLHPPVRRTGSRSSQELSRSARLPRPYGREIGETSTLSSLAPEVDPLDERPDLGCRRGRGARGHHLRRGGARLRVPRPRGRSAEQVPHERAPARLAGRDVRAERLGAAVESRDAGPRSVTGQAPRRDDRFHVAVRDRAARSGAASSTGAGWARACIRRFGGVRSGSSWHPTQPWAAWLRTHSHAEVRTARPSSSSSCKLHRRVRRDPDLVRAVTRDRHLSEDPPAWRAVLGRGQALDESAAAFAVRLRELRPEVVDVDVDR